MPINLFSLFHDTQDKDTIIKMCNEYIEIYGVKSILRRWNDNQSVLDPLYQDMLSITELDKTNGVFNNIDTFVVFDYQRFNQVLNSYGMAIEQDTTIEGMMKLEDNPQVDDLIQFLYPYDNRYHTFKIGSVDIHKDICYRLQLNIYYQDVKQETSYKLNEPKKAKRKPKKVDINRFKGEVIHI